jgi:predicted amino acid racemase
MTYKDQYPRLEIYTEKIRKNVQQLHRLCHESGISLTGVVKGCNAKEEVTKMFEEENYHSIGTSRVTQLKKMREMGINSPLMLVRIPMLSELEALIQYGDISLNSDKTTLIKLDRLAGQYGKKHKVVLMKDLGDLREGVWAEEDFMDLALFVEEQLDLILTRPLDLQELSYKHLQCCQLFLGIR